MKKILWVIVALVFFIGSLTTFFSSFSSANPYGILMKIVGVADLVNWDKVLEKKDEKPPDYLPSETKNFIVSGFSKKNIVFQFDEPMWPLKVGKGMVYRYKAHWIKNGNSFNGIYFLAAAPTDKEDYYMPKSDATMTDEDYKKYQMDNDEKAVESLSKHFQKHLF